MSRKPNNPIPNTKDQGFQRIADSYMVPTYLVSDYLGETQPPAPEKPTKEDLQRLIEQCRANMDPDGEKDRRRLYTCRDLLLK